MGALVAALLLAACGGGAPRPSAELEGPRPGDTLFVARSGEWAPPTPEPGGVGPTPAGSARPPAAGLAGLVPGFRVQVFQSLSLVEAERHQALARRQLGLAAYVEFRAPYYRVRVGDCPTREAGLDLLGRAARGGFPGADLVETLITAPPDAGGTIVAPANTVYPDSAE